MPTQIQEYEEDASQYVQGGYKLEDGTLWRSCFRVPRRFAYDNYRLTPLAEHSGQRFKQGYIVVCQDPTLVDIMEQLRNVNYKERQIKLALRNIGALGLSSFITGGGVSLLSSGEPFLVTSGAVVGGAIGVASAQFAEKTWFEEQIKQLSQVVDEHPDNIIIDLDLINKALHNESLQSAIGSDWFDIVKRINPIRYSNCADSSSPGMIISDLWSLFITPSYSSAALTFAGRYKECQEAYHAVQREQDAREARNSVGMTTDYTHLKACKGYADELLSTSLLQLFDDVREVHSQSEREKQERHSRRGSNAIIERLTTVTEEEIKCQSAKVFHDELMRSLRGDTLMSLDEREQGVCMQAVQWAMGFIDKLPRMITPSLSIHDAYNHFQGEIKVMTDGKLTLPTTEEFQQKYPVIDQGVV